VEGKNIVTRSQNAGMQTKSSPDCMKLWFSVAINESMHAPLVWNGSKIMSCMYIYIYILSMHAPLVWNGSKIMSCMYMLCVYVYLYTNVCIDLVYTYLSIYVERSLEQRQVLHTKIAPKRIKYVARMNLHACTIINM